MYFHVASFSFAWEAICMSDLGKLKREFYDRLKRNAWRHKLLESLLDISTRRSLSPRQMWVARKIMDELEKR